MKRFASALAALLLGTAPALSGSYTPVPVDPVVPTPMPVPAFNWTGGYAGFHFGTLSARHRLTFPTNTVLGTQPNASGLDLGIYAGYNWQTSGNVVFGIEGEYSRTRARGTDLLSNASGPISDIQYGTDISATAALRLRAGIARDRTLFYATLGLAQADTRLFRREGTPLVLSHELREWRRGWTAGFGVEHALQNNWTLRADYRYSDFGRRSVTTEFPGIIDISARLNTHQIRLGLARRF